jgi:8-oxo-dGTP pyrophosphatase MutT (NUDIX family)
MNRGAGICVFDERSGRMLFLLRSKDLTWGIAGGHSERGEKPFETALREFVEEVGYRGKLLIDDEPIAEICISARGFAFRRGSCQGFTYTVFRAAVLEAFVPVLDAEHHRYVWADVDRPPEPLHPGLALTLYGLPE